MTTYCRYLYESKLLPSNYFSRKDLGSCCQQLFANVSVTDTRYFLLYHSHVDIMFERHFFYYCGFDTASDVMSFDHSCFSLFCRRHVCTCV